MREEAILLKRIKNGDSSAIEALVKLYYSNIFRYCLWHTRDYESAEDATQDTFLKAIGYLDRYVHNGKFKSFLYTIASNVCTDLWRKKQSESLKDSHFYMDKEIEKVESDITLYETIKNLSKDQQEVVILRFVHDLKIREIAEVLGEPMRTVQSRLKAALKLLKGNLMKGEGLYE